LHLFARVARWFLFRPKIPIWVNFWGPLDWKMLIASWPFGIFYRHLRYFTTIWYILCSFGTFFGFWYHVARKIWQPWFSPANVALTSRRLHRDKNLAVNRVVHFQCDQIGRNFAIWAKKLQNCLKFTSTRPRFSILFFF
jgi:hypothetical protein